MSQVEIRILRTIIEITSSSKSYILFLIIYYIIIGTSAYSLFCYCRRIENIIIRSTIKMSTIVLYNITMIDHYDHDMLSLSLFLFETEFRRDTYNMNIVE